MICSRQVSSQLLVFHSLYDCIAPSILAKNLENIMTLKHASFQDNMTLKHESFQDNVTLKHASLQVL